MKANQLVLLFLSLTLGVAATQQTNSLLGVTNSSDAFAFFSQAQQTNSTPGVANSDTFSAFKAKAENGDANAQFLIGYYYLVGQGVSMDKRSIAGECELRGQEQFSFELPRICAGRFGQT